LYVRFFRIAERRIAERTGHGIVAYISNFSYLSDPSFVIMRERFIAEFDQIWIDCMNGDSRETGKLTPDGRPDPSVFSTGTNRQGIRVGTAIALMARTQGSGDNAQVRYRDFWGVTKRNDLLRSLESGDSEGDYSKVEPSPQNRYLFRPTEVSSEYLSWPPLPELAETSPTLGILENRRDALLGIDREALRARIRLYFDPNADLNALRKLAPGLTEDAARFDAKRTRARVITESQFDDQSIRRVLVRPMDYRWCYYTPIRPLWNEPRPEYVKQCWPGNSAIVTRRAAVATPEGMPVYFTSVLGLQHAMHTDAYYIPLRFRPTVPETNELQAQLIPYRKDEVTPTPNVSQKALKYLSDLGLGLPDSDKNIAELIWMHVLATCFSPLYLTQHAHGVRADWPRIPLPASAELLTQSAQLGRQLAALLDAPSDTEAAWQAIRTDSLREIGPLSTLDRTGVNLRVTAGWGHATPTGVMPGQGLIRGRSYSASELQSMEGLVESTGMTVAEILSLLGDRTTDIHVNGTTYWRNIPSNVWRFTVGGYQIIKKWLSYRESALLARDMTSQEARYVTQMARRITLVLLLQPSLDASYQQTLASLYAWTGSAADFQKSAAGTDGAD